MFTCNMGQSVAITQKTFSANLWYQQMNKMSTATASIRFLILCRIYLCLCFKMKINKLHTFYTVQIRKLHGLTRSYTLRLLTPKDSPGTLSTISIVCKADLCIWREKKSKKIKFPTYSNFFQAVS